MLTYKCIYATSEITNENLKIITEYGQFKYITVINLRAKLMTLCAKKRKATLG